MIKPEDIAKYLISTGKFKNVTKVEDLKGGLLNHAYLVHTNRGQIVVKQYGETLRYMPEIALPEGRYESEKNAYALFSTLLNEKINPEVYHCDDAQKIIVMEFLDDSRRVDRIVDSIPLEKFFQVGKLLAEIINKTYQKNELLVQFSSLEFQELKYHYRYYIHIQNPALFEIRDSLMVQFRKNRVAVMHGDLRFSNMFYCENKFYFIDYEGAYYADTALDIAYLLSEILIYHYEYPSKSYGVMAKNLWQGFIENITIDVDKKELEERVIEHAGFALIDKVKGKVTKGDYPFVANREAAETFFEEIILNRKIQTISQLIGLSYPH